LKHVEKLMHVEYWIWLQKAMGQGSAKPSLLLEHLGSIEAIYNAQLHDYITIIGLTRREITSLCDKSLDKSKTTIEKCMALGIKVITFEDEAYPQRLKNIYGPPCVLYIIGELAPVDDAVLIALVGTRQVTQYGIEVATKLAMGLAAHGAIVVSGLAMGVDTASHKGALKGGGRTYAVIGCGHDINYPASNRELKRLISSNGAVVSEYPPGSAPISMNFPIRNRIIAGLSLGTVVIEAGDKSGALITASIAAESGRDIFAVPGNIFSPMSMGSNRLLRDGAKPVCSVMDILEEYIERYGQNITLELPIEQSELFKEATQKLIGATNKAEKRRGESPSEPEITFGGTNVRKPQNLSSTQAAVYNVLSSQPIHVDDIALRANLEPRIVLSVLTALEIQGYARSFPGRRFVAF